MMRASLPHALGMFGGALFLLAPLSGLASVQINEIAWMGTSVSANDEWIELYNPDESSVDLTNWTLSWALSGSSPKSVALSGSIPAKGYYLLERTSDETVTGVAADLVYVGALSNSGETLVLKNASEQELDRVDGSDGWKISGSVAGDNGTKSTAQRGTNGWITAVATPRAANATAAATASAASTPTAFSAEQDTSTRSSVIPEVVSATTISAHDSSLPIETTSKTPELLSVTPGRERVGITRVPLTFSASAYDTGKKAVSDARYVWNFGDGSTGEGKTVAHAYRFPGEYIVVLHASRGSAEEAIGRTLVTVARPQVVISDVQAGIQGSYVEVRNAGKLELNLGGWHLLVGARRFTFPRDTLLAAGKQLAFPFEVTGLAIADEPVQLAYPDQTAVSGARFERKPPVMSPAAAAGMAATTTGVAAALLDPQVELQASLQALKGQIATLMLHVPITAPAAKAKAVAQGTPEQKREMKLTGVAPSPPPSASPRVLFRDVPAAPEQPPRRVIVIPKEPSMLGALGTFITNLFSRE